MQYKEYLDNVCHEIKFKAAHKTLRHELTAHIDDKKEALEKNGVHDAETVAIKQMGDATETGIALNSIHKPRTEWGVIICVLLLSIAGLTVLLLSSTNDIYFAKGDTVGSQILAVLLGLSIMVGMIFFDYIWLLRLRYVFYAAALVLSVLCVLTGGWNQPQSLLSPTFVTTISTLLFLLSIIGVIDKSKDRRVLGLICIGVLCAISLFVMIQIPSFVHTLILLIAYLTVLSVAIRQNHFAPNHRWLYFLIVFGIVSVVIFAIIVITPDFRLNRFSFGTNIDATCEGYCTAIARNMLAGAQLIGPSEYFANQGLLHLPWSSTNYIFTAIIGAYGWLLGIGIAFAFIAMFTFMILRSQKIQHTFGKLLATGISAFLLIRFILCILTNTGVFGGIECNLPFISYGRFDYVVNALLIGIFLAVWRRSTFMEKDMCDNNKYKRANKSNQQFK